MRSLEIDKLNSEIYPKFRNTEVILNNLLLFSKEKRPVKKAYFELITTLWKVLL